MNPRVLVFTLCTFAFGSAAFIFAGLLEVMAADLGVSTAVAGQLQTAYVLTAAVGGPTAALFLGRLDRKLVLGAALALGVAMHVACAFTPDFSTLLVLRSLAGLSGAIAGPSATIAAAALSPSERRGSAIAMVTGGMTLAFGWRATFVFAAGLSAVALAGVLAFMPSVKPPPKRQGGRLPVGHIWPLYMTTFLLFAANMTVNLYIAPLVRVGAGVTGAGVGAFQAMIGVGSVAGLWLGARAADRYAGKAWILQGFAIQAAAMSLHFAATHHALPAGWPSQVLVALAIFVAATALFSMTPVVQARLIHMTNGAPVGMALNGSVVAMGQALGSALGGAALAVFGVPAIPGAALGMSLVAFATLLFVFPKGEPAGG
jgi:predicted MFS family arabinose efflux permease